MGKRRDRRQHAALGAGGRRVKLDLWIEDDSPAAKLEERLNATSANVEAGDDKSSVVSGGHPSARPLSGVLQENPLSLLGQYSDDEVEEEEPEMEYGDTNKNENTSQMHHTICDDAQATSYIADSEVRGLLKDEDLVLKDEDLVPGSALPSSEMLCLAQTENHGEAKAINETQTHIDKNVDNVFRSQVKNDSLPSHTYPSRESGGGKMEAQEEELCWEVVLHEESGEYYYWNTRTGETTWETPPALKSNDHSQLSTDTGACKVPEEDASISLIRDPESSLKHDLFPKSDSEDVPKKLQSDAGVYEIECKILSGDMNFDKKHEEEMVLSERVGVDFSKAAPELDNFAVETTVDREEPTIEKLAESNMPKRANSASRSEAKSSTLTKPFSCIEASPERECSASAESENSPRSEPYFTSDELNPLENGQLKEKTDCLLQWAESLTSRSKNITEDGLLSIPLHVRLAIEAEVRLTDCRALSSQGCLEEAFLIYTETQFKRIESVLAAEEAAVSAKLEQQRLTTAAESPKRFLLTADRSQFSRQLYEQTQNDVLPHFEISSCAGIEAAKEETQECNGIQYTAQNPQPQHTFESVKPDHLSNLDGDLATYQVDLRLPSSITGDVDLGHVRELDVDMEVDMDVDDAVETHLQPLSISGSHGKSEMYEVSQVGLAHKMAQEFSYPFCACVSSPLPPGTSISDVWPPPPPPPPDDEWAPPPPEPELVTPPPPEEPPHFATLPMYNISAPLPVQSIPSLAFYEGMAMGFSSISHPSYHYKPVDVQSSDDPTVEFFPNSLYLEGTVQAGEPQVNWTDQHQPFGVPMSIPPDLSVVDLNSVSAVVDYAPPLPVPFSTISIAPLCGTPYMPLGAAPSVALNTESIVEDTCIPFSMDSAIPKVESDAIISAAPNMALVFADSTPSTVVASNSGLGAVVEGALTANIKKPARVTRLKKRTHTVAVSAPLISNKKVSTLVNKWLAAKEELHGKVEDEDDKALYDLEALEKKRQKEIEDWRREQLASGEALENANFQPLGTLDWRERVKRAKKVDGVEMGNNVSLDSPKQSKVQLIEGNSKKPDLEELSKELPSGWQAFWDENSGDVYYGNLVTSETTWERPVSN